jgi:hypothetical protein
MKIEILNKIMKIKIIEKGSIESKKKRKTKQKKMNNSRITGGGEI